MVDTVQTDTLVSGRNIHEIRITGVSDGTGEADVAKVSLSSLIGPDGTAPTRAKLEELQWDVYGWSAIQLEWDGTTDTPAQILSGQGARIYPKGTGPVMDATGGTGNLLLTTIGTGAANYSYDIYIRLRLKD